MGYTFHTRLDRDMDSAVEHVTDALKSKGFGILTTIDVQATMKAKLGVDTPAYRILGACNPSLAHQAMQAEPRIGAMLPCNVILRQLETGDIEVAAVDPVASMQAIENPQLGHVALQVQQLLKQVIEGL
jgi:uncharacterized protein (DUF302 family)